MANETPPLHGKCHLKFPFCLCDYFPQQIPGDANSKLIEIVTVADIDDEKRVNNSLMQILKFKTEVWSLKLSFFESTRFGQDFEFEAQARF